MGLLEQATQGVEGFVHNATTAVSNATAGFLHDAEKATGALFRIENGKVRGPLAEVFGSDPVQFVNNAIRSQLSHFVKISNETARRSGRTTHKVTDPSSKKIVDVPARLGANPPFSVIVMTTVLNAKSAPGVFIDAAGREAAGVGGGKGIDDLYFGPGILANGARGLVEGIPLPTPTDLAAIAAIATAIVGLAALVLPPLISAVGFVVKQISGGGDAAKPKAPPPDPGFLGTGINPIIILVVAAAGLALVLLWKPKAAAAAGG